jgi:ABC-type uncharacterized transport system permease subunit
MRLILTVLFAIFFFSSSIVAQSSAPSITGMVSDTAGRPIAFAEVYVIGRQDTVKTDPRGRFTLDSLQTNMLSLRAE